MHLKTLMRMLEGAEQPPKARKTSSMHAAGRRPTLEAAVPASTAELYRRGIERIEQTHPASPVTHVALPVRILWTCPLCRQRRVNLYHCADGGVSCRGCERLAYQSEQELRYLNTPERIEMVRGKAVKATPHMSKKMEAKAAAAEAELAARDEARRLRTMLSQRLKMQRGIAVLERYAGHEVTQSVQEQKALAELQAAVDAAEARVAAIVAKQRAAFRKAYERRQGM